MNGGFSFFQVFVYSDGINKGEYGFLTKKSSYISSVLFNFVHLSQSQSYQNIIFSIIVIIKENPFTLHF